MQGGGVAGYLDTHFSDQLRRVRQRSRQRNRRDHK
jgi:hypothetical protein